ncbi:MAG: PaaI family thioesterase [Bacteroidota bacterium]|nr:PaaI family thioesterase [Bacteroidota bacterium]
MLFTVPILYDVVNPRFRQLIEDKLSRQHFMKHIGFGLTKIEPGYIEGEALMDTALQQQDGLVHGGVTATVGDIVTGFAAFSLVRDEDRVVTSDLKISYFRPGRGEKVLARGWVIKPGSRLHYCEGEIYVATGNEYTLIAKVYSIMAVIRGKDKELR